MKFVIQRVKKASVSIGGETAGSISKGFLVLIGIGHEDTREDADILVKKMTGLRIFEDENGKTNLSLADVGGALLLISQFTLYANCRRGNRPSFTDAAPPAIAEELYEYIISECRSRTADVQKGVFGAEMQVELCNDGPFTVILDSNELKNKKPGSQE
ncbi:D-aminoacyl-tRNA deacylase [Murimonas intestini]|uniref:D-aminoacyl-tRNA deacylase n=1 Tax=Murimonas intestini TaxID=1337051 RepID=A0AB73TAG4_9FIRM|nr:D-aminoacyl-tRNA deacylase [Murimonas intestini]MCR1839045.1 D-aminoacyl-tRNA deacylase [Murimonas intestini]MCR1864341.1 D-aminoacyl-tRNA deacylase [Murimonas intestini]MCR1881951.1 D-aminoacyl-tRNA deacylase [Murimonas intestini]